MRNAHRASTRLRAQALATVIGLGGSLVGLTGCGGSESSSGSGSNQPTQTDFVVEGTNVVNGSIWKLNRPIDVTFSEAIDPTSVNSNTIQISDSTGSPALGEYSLVAPDVVRFQPLCPTNVGSTNGGLQQNRVYFLVIVGSNTSAVTVRNTAGEPVETGVTVSFQTPNSSDPVELFVDQVAGPPAVLVRGLGGVPLNSENASYVEFGGDPDDREYLQLNLATQTGQITSLVPLNLYSREDQRFAVVLRFNQPVNAAPTNVSANRIRYEFLNALTSTWVALPTAVALIDNCTAIGSSVRVTPEGLVPQGAQVRINIRDGFEDLTGDAVEADLVNFVRLVSETVNTPGTTDPTEGADEVFETFAVGGGGPDSREDLLADSTKPRADWGNGQIQPSFAFGGTGGPGGNFDWVVRSGQTLIIDTAADQILGGPGGIETTVQTVINGVIDVRNMTVQPGARLLFAGPNTVTILASGSVDIQGLVSVNGGDNPGVKTLNTTNQPEPGASGNAGGGTGGTGSFLTSQSTPRGGAAFGAFQRAGFGGGGGETSYAPNSIDRRRGAGGGGGRFGQDVRYIAPGGQFVRCQSLIGFDAEPGFPGGDGGTGAISQTSRAQGGVMGPFPFFDQSNENDFFGVMRTAPVLGTGGQVLEPSRLIIGELSKVWAGAGGGAGGDAVSGSTFPITPFNPGGDEKGSGGGGGAGGIQILSIGEIRIRATGELRAEGGYGGAGENSIFFDRIGGGGGGGSGGHIVLSSAARILVEAEAPEGTGFNQASAFYTDNPSQLRHPLRPVGALGGQGGAGKDDACGANANGVRDWKVDAIPASAFEGLTTVPPFGNTPNNNSFLACNNGSVNDPEGTTPGAGGDGSPGIIQLHATNMDAQILFPNRPGLYGTGKDVTFSCAPPPLGWTLPTEVPDQMIPFFGDESEAISKWISLGQARRNPDGSTNQVLFSFGGTDLAAPALADQGIVLRNGTSVADLAPAIAFAGIVPSQTAVPFLTGGNTVTLDATGLDELYKKNTALVRNFAVRLRDSQDVTNYVDFRVVDATYDPTLDRLVARVDPQGSLLVDSVLVFNPDGEIGLLPNFFQVVSAGIANSYPFNTTVRVTFDATNTDPLTGLPDDTQRFSVTQNAGELTPDITDLNAANWDFIRFRVEFDLDAAATGVNLSAPRPALEYLKIPFRF